MLRATCWPLRSRLCGRVKKYIASVRNALSRFGRSSISAEYGFLLHWAGPWLSILLLYDKMCIAVSLEAASALFGCGYHLWWFIAGWTVSGHFFLARYFDVRIGIVLRFAFSAGRGWVLCAGLCNVVFVITLERIVRGRLFGGPINVALPVRARVVTGGEMVLRDGDASVIPLSRIHCKFTEPAMVCAKHWI